MKYALSINGKQLQAEVDPDTPLLWVLRDTLNLKGTKFGCGMSQCGACTVHLDGKPIRSCVTPISAIGNKSITTIEGISADAVGQKVQQAWKILDVPQCGYCQAGQIMAAVSLLKQFPQPTDQQIDSGMSRNLCRCATYHRIRAAIHQAADAVKEG
ncbi:(2Fe-2S)-binding protein [Shewanella avicenniae]|uniref:(2Fe-2S)-binding protein n=1 Tax=Shewanella avicenniae TaxID=2814294 RepID=A0ABX7QSE5_9GAMM|nr:(2Fe-2S)-binding protein [Shewanella avicenniae]QSX33606.1 (2Fe-2S)-binding protein [Shewanella avicenniae]